MKRKALAFVTMGALAVTACACVLTACGGSEEESFSAPENVKVQNTTLSWDAVEGAVEYTVRVGDSGTNTVTSTSTSLSLTTGTIATYFTATADYKLYVKVNATDDKKESVYSAPVIYHYQSVPQKGTFTKPSGLKIENDILSWNPVLNATNGYIVTVVGTEDAHEVTGTSISLSSFQLTEGATVKFSVKVKETATMNESEAAVSEEYIVPDPAQIIENAIKAITAVKEALTDDNEEIIADVDEFEETYHGYADFVKTDEGVIAAWKELTDARDDAKANIEADLDALAESVDELVGKTYVADRDALEAAHEALLDKQKEIGDIDGAYASKYWADTYADKETAIEDEVKEILSIAVETVSKSSSVLLNNEHSERSAIYVMRRYINILGDAIELDSENIPEPAVSENVTLSEKVSYNKNTGYYVWELTFAKIEAGSVENITVSYRFEGETEIALTLTAPSPVIYNVNTNEGKLASTAAAGETLYLDIYLASDVALGTNNGDKDLIFSGAPIVSRQEVINGTTLEDSLKSFIARAGKTTDEKGEEFVFVLYRLEENGGVLTYSNTSGASIMKKKYVVTKEDALVRLPFTDNSLEANADGFNFTGAFNEDFINELLTVFNGVDGIQFTKADLENAIRFYADVTYNGKTERVYFNTEVVIPQEGNGRAYFGADELKLALYKAFGEVENGTFEFTVGITYTEEMRNVCGEYLRDSLSYSKGEISGISTTREIPQTDVMDLGFDYGTGVITLVNPNTVDTLLNGDFFKLKDLIATFYPEDPAFADYDSLTNEEKVALVARYLEIRIAATDTETGAELFVTHAMFKNGGFTTNELILRWTAEYFSDPANKDKTESEAFGYKIMISLVPKQFVGNTETENKLYGFLLESPSSPAWAMVKPDESSDPVRTDAFTVTLEKSLVTTPTAGQLDFNGAAGYFQFIRGGSSGYANSGEVFSNPVYATKYIEVAFTNNASADVTDRNATDVYRVYLFNENGTVKIYLNADRSDANPLECAGGLNDCYKTVAEFKNWLPAEFDFDVSQTCYFYTRIEVNLEESVYLVQGEFSEQIVYNP